MFKRVQVVPFTALETQPGGGRPHDTLIRDNIQKLLSRPIRICDRMTDSCDGRTVTMPGRVLRDDSENLVNGVAFGLTVPASTVVEMLQEDENANVTCSMMGETTQPVSLRQLAIDMVCGTTGKIDTEYPHLLPKATLHVKYSAATDDEETTTMTTTFVTLTCVVPAACDDRRINFNLGFEKIHHSNEESGLEIVRTERIPEIITYGDKSEETVMAYYGIKYSRNVTSAVTTVGPLSVGVAISVPYSVHRDDDGKGKWTVVNFRQAACSYYTTSTKSPLKVISTGTTMAIPFDDNDDDDEDDQQENKEGKSNVRTDSVFFRSYHNNSLSYLCL